MPDPMRNICCLLFIFLPLGFYGQTSPAQQLSEAERWIGEEEGSRALPLLEQAIAGFRELDDCYGEAKTQLNFGEVYYMQGFTQQALEVTLDAKNLLEDCLRADTVDFYSLVLQNLGVFHARLGDYDNQLRYYTASFQQALRFHGMESEQGADAYFSMGAAFGRRGYWDKCIAYTDTSLAISRRINYQGGEASALHNLAYAYGEQRDYQRAVEYQLQAMDLTESQSELAKGYHNLAGLYADLKDLDRAEQSLQKAFELRSNLPVGHPARVSTLLTMAEIYFRKAAYARAEIYLQRAISELERSDEPNPRLLKVSYIYRANMVGEQGRYEAALASARAAESIAVSDLDLKSSNDLCLAWYLTETGHGEEGLRYMDRAIELLMPGFSRDQMLGHPTYERIQDFDKSLTLLSEKASLLRKLASVEDEARLDRLRESLRYFLQADTLAYQIRLRLQHQRSKESLLWDVSDMYGKALRTCYDLFQLTGDQRYIDQAFRFSEKNKAQLIAENLNDQYLRNYTGVSTELVSRERKLMTDIGFYTAEIEWGTGYAARQTLDSWEERLRDSRRALEEVRRELRLSHPDYYNFRHAFTIAPLREVQERLLGPREVMLEYMLTGEDIFLILVTRGSASLHRWPMPVEFHQELRDFRTAILAQDDSYWDLAHDMYQVLLAPVADDISGKDLCIVADGVLGYLPYETFLTQSPADGEISDIRTAPYLIRAHQVRYLFSAQVALLALETDRTSRGRKGMLAMAPSFEHIAQGDNPRLAELTSLPELEGARQEVEQLSKKFAGRFLSGQEASESAFLALAPDYAVLHIATHTLVDDVFPAFSRLVFSPKAESALGDGQLRIFEIYSMDLNADLVTLSACNTGYGLMMEGEGIYSLARAFAYAGSPNLVMTQWPVKDKTTAVLMERFYSNLAQGMNKPAALHEAKLHYLDHYSSSLLVHPYYWGGFVYAGDLGVVDLPERSIWMRMRDYWWLAIGVVGLLILFQYAIRRRRTMLLF